MGLINEIMNGPYGYRAIRGYQKEMREWQAQEYSKQWISAKMNGKHRNIRSKRTGKR